MRNDLKNRMEQIFKGFDKKMSRLFLILICGVCLMVVVWPVKSGSDDSGAERDNQSEKGSEGEADYSFWNSEGDEQDTDDSNGNTGNNEYSVSKGANTGADSSYGEYEEYLENKLKLVISSMENISSVEVMITTLDDGESVTLKDSEVSEKNQDNASEKSEKETTVYGQGESGEEPFVTQYKKPEVQGVVVCCKGGNEGDNSLKITQAVQALFDVPAHKIVVLEAN